MQKLSAMKMDSSYDKLKQLLKQTIGLDAGAVGDATIRKILNQRMRACKIQTMDTYLEYLSNNHNELADLLETAVIPETWFFRDSRPFGIILNHIQQNTDRYQISPCNILSIPCATGEEPYSLTMYLLENGIQNKTFKIQAVDISQRALDIARHGYYGNNSFRGKIEKKYINNYFTIFNDIFVINDNLKHNIDFCRINILDSKSLPYNKFFDFVLCRNLLIYFDVNTKQTALNNLHRCLKNTGMLFIGHSEFGAIPKELFQNTGSENAFGLVKQDYKFSQPKPDQALKSKKISTLPTAATQSNIQQPPTIKPFSKADATRQSPENIISTPNDNPLLLEQARTLADQGKLIDAESLCYQHVKTHGESADSFFLLGLISTGSGKDDNAENFFRKAIYLDPKHYHSLVHLTLLLEKRGDLKNAKLMQQRADRALKT